MTLSITSALSLFVLIALSTAVFFAAKRFKLPYTVFLVLVGLLLVPIVNLPYLNGIFGFLGDMVLTPELLFFIFLPVLIFESGFNMNIRRMIDSSWSIMSLAIVGVVISTVIIAGLLYLLLPLIGFEIPFILALLFGAVISATDPVAVLSLFKEFGVPRRLGLIFEGESLFNDGTAVALFLVLLAVATDGFHGAGTVVDGIFTFVVMIVLGVLFGLAVAAIFARAIRFTKSNEFVTITLLIISAHLVFILTELINHSGIVHISSIIATTVAALFLGNYSRDTLPPRVDNYLGKLIEHMSFVVNSLVFILAGLLFATVDVDFGQLWVPILVTVIVVAFARLIAVYAVVLPLNKLKREAPIPSSWRKLLAWGSLRGALAIIIVLTIPEDFTVEGWNYLYSPRDFLLALTIGCILATLFIKAPLIGPLIRRYKIDAPEPLKLAHEADLGIYYLLTEKSRLLMHKTKGFVSPEQYEELLARVLGKLEEARTEREALAQRHGRTLFDQSLHLAMIHIEQTTLKRLYNNNEVSERTHRKLSRKLSLQIEKIEQARQDEIDPTVYTDRKDIFDRMVDGIQRFFTRASAEDRLEDRLEYYRAQMIMARKAVQGVQQMQEEYDEPVFIENSYARVTALYRRYKEECGAKADALVAKHEAELSPYLAALARRSLSASGARALGYLHDNGLVDEDTEEEIRHRFTA